MRILHATSELYPYSKSGGLADMVSALTKALARAGHQVGVVTPLYRRVLQQFPECKLLDWRMELPLGPQRVTGRVWTHEPHPGLTVYLLDQPHFYDRPALYTDRGVDYSDNARRFIFLCKAAVHLARYLPAAPEVVHLHDWQTALGPLLIRHQSRFEGWADAPSTCLTIHNLAYQGVFPRRDYALTNLPWDHFQPGGAEFYAGLNCLKAGLLFADQLTTVSPSYAREITTPALGCGLDGVLRLRQNALTGILNGVDYDEWDPGTDRFLQHHYSASDLGGKLALKTDLQAALGLTVDPALPLFVTVTRLVDQKGPDILLAALEQMLANPMQFALLGSGDSRHESAFLDLAARYPSQVSVKIGFDLALSHQFEAAGDFFLMPSRFEPCGLNQMYSQRYGTIPIVRATGGLDDSVTDIAESRTRADGIKFRDYSPAALAKAIRKALVLYHTPDLLQHYRRNAMQADFSWERTREEYLRIYGDLLKVRPA